MKEELHLRKEFGIIRTHDERLDKMSVKQKKGNSIGIFKDYESDVDSALRSKSKSDDILPLKVLDHYKKEFVSLVRNNIEK